MSQVENIPAILADKRFRDRRADAVSNAGDLNVLCKFDPGAVDQSGFDLIAFRKSLGVEELPWCQHPYSDVHDHQGMAVDGESHEFSVVPVSVFAHQFGDFPGPGGMVGLERGNTNCCPDEAMPRLRGDGPHRGHDGITIKLGSIIALQEGSDQDRFPRSLGHDGMRRLGHGMRRDRAEMPGDEGTYESLL